MFFLNFIIFNFPTEKYKQYKKHIMPKQQQQTNIVKSKQKYM